MEKLKPEEIENMTTEQAWDIAGDFGDYIANRKPAFIEYEDVLPYEKEVILLALLKTLKDDNHLRRLSAASGGSVKDIKENIAVNIMILETGFIPNEKKYKETVELMKISDKVFKKIKK